MVEIVPGVAKSTRRGRRQLRACRDICRLRASRDLLRGIRPRRTVRCHSVLTAKHFPSDFYVTCVTVMPVLFLAVAAQQKAYEFVLRVTLMAVQPRRGERARH